jgi:hypothetical protein
MAHDDLPEGLRAALAERGAVVDQVIDEAPRRFVHAGAWFGRVTSDPADRPRLAHEAAARKVGLTHLAAHWEAKVDFLRGEFAEDA